MSFYFHAMDGHRGKGDSFAVVLGVKLQSGSGSAINVTHVLLIKENQLRFTNFIPEVRNFLNTHHVNLVGWLRIAMKTSNNNALFR